MEDDMPESYVVKFDFTHYQFCEIERSVWLSTAHAQRLAQLFGFS
jgi:hypothetical protein